jgi:putative heme-binding domain-containing protein
MFPVDGVKLGLQSLRSYLLVETSENLLGAAAHRTEKLPDLPALALKGDVARAAEKYMNASAVNATRSATPARTTHLSKEGLMADILMPNLNNGYEEYLVETNDDQMSTGILANNTPAPIVLRRRKGDDEDAILRSAIKSMRSQSVSPMPEDLDINIEHMADLIAYIKILK